MTRTLLAALLAVAGALTAIATLAPPASAAVDGPCTITIDGQDVSQSNAAIRVGPDENLAYVLDAETPIRSWRVVAHYGPLDIPVASQTFAEGGGLTHYDGTFSFESLRRYGTGIYEVSGDATLEDGRTCRVGLDVKLTGSVFSTPVGIAAVVGAVVGGGGLLWILIRTVLDAKDVRDQAKEFIENARRTGGRAAAATAPAVAVKPSPPPTDAEPAPQDGTEWDDEVSRR
ncbi:MAG TPA: hypothetical protein VI796_01530 [Candidatus Thermoplasmatota archaeon]|nr:hypothetical protein [Candidatus Thermoplasmatota archaeon]